MPMTALAPTTAPQLAESTYTNGEVGQAFNFDRSSGYVQVPSSPNLKFTNALTAEA